MNCTRTDDVRGLYVRVRTLVILWRLFMRAGLFLMSLSIWCGQRAMGELSKSESESAFEIWMRHEAIPIPARVVNPLIQRRDYLKRKR